MHHNIMPWRYPGMDLAHSTRIRLHYPLCIQGWLGGTGDIPHEGAGVTDIRGVARLWQAPPALGGVDNRGQEGVP